jgi:hypothetical protein
MMRPPGPRVDLALDGGAVLELLGGSIAGWLGFPPTLCRARLLKQTERRLLVRYELGDEQRSASVVGKWFSSDRGELVARSLSVLSDHGFRRGRLIVPALLAYVPEVRALFCEAVEATPLADVLRQEPLAARGAGTWLATFHAAPLEIPRSCGREKQRASTLRWAAETPQLAVLAAELDRALAGVPDPGLLVHYDYYYGQVALATVPSPPPSVARDGARVVTFDLDEAGMGNPAFDLAHFEAHLELLALRSFDRPDALAPAVEAFRLGYAETAPLPQEHAALKAFAWFKLAHQLFQRGAPEAWRRHAMAAARALLAGNASAGPASGAVVSD